MSETVKREIDLGVDLLGSPSAVQAAQERVETLTPDQYAQEQAGGGQGTDLGVELLGTGADQVQNPEIAKSEARAQVAVALEGNTQETTTETNK